MFAARRPSDQDIERFLADSRELPLSYGPPGLTQAAAPPGRVDESRTRIGGGPHDFERACDALAAWTHFDLSWVQLFPRRASISVGTVVAVCIRHLGFWSLNGARVVDRIAGDDRRFGFAYGTLTDHAEHGEELFEVRLDPQSGDVIYRIRAVSWPQAPLARVGYPFVRHLQSRFRRDSSAAMARAVTRP